jgi:hypothetical protein
MMRRCAANGKRVKLALPDTKKGPPFRRAKDLQERTLNQPLTGRVSLNMTRPYKDSVNESGDRRWCERARGRHPLGLDHRSRFSFPMLMGDQGTPGMYVVRAINVDGVTGTFKAEKNTRREALELARSLRKEGFLVLITEPDGKTVEDEPE